MPKNLRFSGLIRFINPERGKKFKTVVPISKKQAKAIKDFLKTSSNVSHAEIDIKQV